MKVPKMSHLFSTLPTARSNIRDGGRKAMQRSSHEGSETEMRFMIVFHLFSLLIVSTTP